jgi:hypothetical protein
MPPQQSDGLLDLGDNGFDFRAHVRHQISAVGNQISSSIAYRNRLTSDD